MALLLRHTLRYGILAPSFSSYPGLRRLYTLALALALAFALDLALTLTLAQVAGKKMKVLLDEPSVPRPIHENDKYSEKNTKCGVPTILG